MQWPFQILQVLTSLVTTTAPQTCQDWLRGTEPSYLHRWWSFCSFRANQTGVRWGWWGNSPPTDHSCGSWWTQTPRPQSACLLEVLFCGVWRSRFTFAFIYQFPFLSSQSTCMYSLQNGEHMHVFPTERLCECLGSGIPGVNIVSNNIIFYGTKINFCFSLRLGSIKKKLFYY